jgi:hypothetical protein
MLYLHDERLSAEITSALFSLSFSASPSIDWFALRREDSRDRGVFRSA